MITQFGTFNISNVCLKISAIKVYDYIS